MKILFVSNLSPIISSGPSWSVPARVDAQKKFDDVKWVNCNEATMPHWVKTGVFYKLSDIGGDLNLKNINKIFGHIDIVVFDQCYFPKYLRLAKDLRKKYIPYIIVPRSSFTYQAMNNHAKWKKKLAGWLFFNKFFKGASAIQYLTKQEKIDSKLHLLPKGFIIPNGIFLPQSLKKQNSRNSIKGVYIGRIDIYQKGLDVLLKAIQQNIEYLKEKHLTIDIYGPVNKDYLELKRYIKDANLEAVVTLNKEIGGLEKEKVLKKADFFIMTSRFEGQPMALLEALSYSLPCIVTQGTNMREEVESIGAGIGCDFNEESVGKGLCKVAQDPEVILNKDKNAYKLASNYQWNELASKFHDILFEIINEKKVN